MLKIKTGQFNQQPDFRNTGIRRLMEALSETQDSASKSLERLEQYIANGNLDLGLQEIQSDDELRYWLENIFGNKWTNFVTGNII